MSGLFQLNRFDTMEGAVPFNERLEQSGDIQVYAKEFTEFLLEPLPSRSSE